MENPEKEIEETVLKLTRGSPRVQQQTLESYFTPNASFQHPVCAVNGSRHNILMVYRWYKIMSPTIELKVDGVGMLLLFHDRIFGSADPLTNSLRQVQTTHVR